MSNIIPFQEMTQMADAIAKSGLFGMRDRESVLALMAVAQAEGLHPATAARDFHIIQGRPALKADAMLARFQNAGGKVTWTEYTDEKVTGTFTHPNGGELAVTWTIEQATRIGLVKPGSGWQKFPRAMLRSRCISEGIRSVFPGSVTGFYTPDEVEGFDAPPVVVKDITPAKPALDAIAAMPSDPVDEVDFTEGTHALKLPNQEDAYKLYKTHEDWVNGFCELVAKIYDNQKLSKEEKEAKYFTLCEANQYMISHLPAVEKTIYTQNTVKIRRGE